MVSEFSVRAVENGFIVAWTSRDSQGEIIHDEKVFLTKSDMEPFITDLLLNLRQL